MRKFISHFSIALFLVLCSFTTFADVAPVSDSIVGTWVMKDDDGISRSIVKFDSANGQMLGTIIEILPTKGQKPTDRCVKCTGEYYNKPELGMVVVWELKKQNDTWEGKVLDPDNGDIYNCQITISEDHQTLHLHAYEGIPILGETLDWSRVS
jgi:uncharacterized protein (DUF2147 family)